MNCEEFNLVLDDLLINGREALDRLDVTEHLDQCRSCAWQHAGALETLEAITPSHQLRASADLKQRIVHTYKPAPSARSGHERTLFARRIGVRALLAFATAAVVLLTISLSHNTRSPGLSAFSLLSEATAAEARFFADGHLVQLVSEIIVKPIADSELAAMRWLPLISLGPDGKPQYRQLKLAAKPGESYTLRDASWYDPATGRFARVISVEDRTLFAHSFDGEAIYTLASDEKGEGQVERAAVSKDFRPPTNPAEFLGIAAGLTSALDQKDRHDLVTDAGRTTLEDGSSARVVKLGFSPIGPPDKPIEAYYRAVIRDEDHTMESFDFVVQGKSLFVVRRAKPEATGEPPAGWNLAMLKSTSKAGPAPIGLAALADLVKPNVTPEDMAQSADFPVYIFKHSPSWAAERQIMDILDIPNPPHRMFATTYRAKDGRHVVLVQGHTFNENLGPLTEAGKLVYTSPNGIKVYSGAHDDQFAEILLQSARAVLRDPPAKDRTAYLLTTPENTHPVLAVNGRLSDDELHGLIDNLEMVKK